MNNCQRKELIDPCQHFIRSSKSIYEINPDRDNGSAYYYYPLPEPDFEHTKFYGNRINVHICRYIKEKGKASFTELHEHIRLRTDRNKPISTSTLTEHLTELESEGIILKKGKEYRLRKDDEIMVKAGKKILFIQESKYFPSGIPGKSWKQLYQEANFYFSNRSPKKEKIDT